MHRAETAAFLNHKGGVGKTTSVANTGAGLTLLGKRVLLVDLDPQSHLTGFLGIGQEEIGATIYDVLRGRAQLREAIVTRPLKARLYIDGRDSQLSMSLVPSSIELSEAEMTLAGTPMREYLLRRALSGVAGDYDYILLDCPPSLGLISVNALAASRKVFIPIQTEHLALQSLESLMEKIESVMAELNQDLVIGGLIATRYDGRKNLSRTVVEALRERFGVLLLDTMIRENIVLAESPRHGMDIFSYRPRSYGMEDYLNLSLEIMGRIAAANTLFSVERGVIRSNDGTGESDLSGRAGGGTGDGNSIVDDDSAIPV
ncbi:MAG: ParA family protein [Candidatus Krumholzibacteria bacterium]|nr:ParA family protein [Candidatus Krumholzibacteria bacterium]